MFHYFLKQRLKKHDALNNIKISQIVKAALLEQSASTLTTMGIGNDKPHDIVVSLTSFDQRIEEVYLCIESLFQQSLPADRIVLWLSEKNFPGRSLPETLLRQIKRGLQIEFVDEDLGPYKKYVYAFPRFPDSLIITVDDDTLYPPDMIDMLYRAYINNPNCIHCHRGHQMTYDRKGNLKPYDQWLSGNIQPAPSLSMLPTGMGGVLYFPGSLHEEAFNKKSFMSLCPNADDIWLKAMSIKQGVKSARVHDNRPWKTRFLTIEGTQSHALKRENWHRRDGNDSKIRKVFLEYDIVEMLKPEKQGQ